MCNAYNPYKAADIMEQYIHGESEDDQETDRFDMIMDALSGVVSEHLKKHGTEYSLRQHEKDHTEDEFEADEYSIDLRNEK